MWFDLQSFYISKEWTGLLSVLKLERLNENGELICEHCGKPITKAYDCIGHHKEELTLDNVNDTVNVSLNPNNIAFVHFKCHNIIHNRYCKWTRHIYLVYGCPLAGKKSWVNENAGQHDLIIDLDRIHTCISNNPMYQKSGRLSDNAFDIRNLLLDMVKTKRGKWVNAFIIGGYPYRGERERLCVEYGAEPIFIECTKETALERLASRSDSINVKEYTNYIDMWFERIQL